MRPGRPADRLAAAALAVVLGVAGGAAAQPKGDDEAGLLVDAARGAIHDGDYPQAGRLLDRALALDPRQVHVYVLRASVYGALRDYDRGIAVMRRARQLAPDNIDVLTALGSQLVLARRFDEGVPLLEKVTARDRRRFEALVLLGHYYADHGRWADAVTALDGYLAARPAALANEDTPHLVARADALLRTGAAVAARDAFRAVLAGSPRLGVARMGQAWATAAIDCRAALDLLARMRDLEARHPEVALVEARCAVAVARWPVAQRAVRAYRTARPDDAVGWGLAGEVRLARNDLAGAAAAFQAAAGRAPADKLWPLRLARVERLQGAAPAAVDRLRAAGAPADRVDEWTVELGEALAAAGRPAEVKALLVPFVDAADAASDPSASAAGVGRGRVLLGTALVRLGEDDAAIGRLERALALEPERSDARRPLQVALGRAALATLRRGDLVQAEHLLARAAALGDDPIIARDLGAVRLMTGDPRGAVQPLEAATSMRAAGTGNVDSGALQLLGQAYRASGAPGDAAGVLRNALPIAVGEGPARAAGVRIDLAGALIDAGEGEEAVDVLVAGMTAKAPADVQARLAEALSVAVRAASTQALASGAFRRAYKMLEAAEPRLPAARADDLLAVRCDLALAATAAGMQDAALRRLRDLSRSHASCPFAAPADALAVPILLAWAEGQGSAARARAALDALDKLRRRATGSAQPLLVAAVRDVALRGAVQAYDGGDLVGARRFLDAAAKVDRHGPELELDQAVLQLAGARQVDQAVASLTRLADLPEAQLALGIAADLAGKPLEALDHYRRAAAAGLHHPELNRWIDAHERLWKVRP